MEIPQVGEFSGPKSPVVTTNALYQFFSAVQHEKTVFFYRKILGLPRSRNQMFFSFKKILFFVSNQWFSVDRFFRQKVDASAHDVRVMRISGEGVGLGF